MKIILASQSLFRKRALDILGLKYETIPSDFDESLINHENSHELARLLSQEKAKNIGETHKDAIIIAADLFIVYKDKIIGKPKSEKSAKDVLLSLSGNTFNIISGLTVYNSHTKKMLSATEECKIKFRKLTEYEIDDYISRYPVTRCAGGFEADGLLRFSESIEGNYNFVAGLPVNKLIIFLRENGIKV